MIYIDFLPHLQAGEEVKVIGVHVNDDTEKPAYSRQLCHLLTFAPILSAEHYLLRIT